jgi:hypothetical protein
MKFKPPRRFQRLLGSEKKPSTAELIRAFPKSKPPSSASLERMAPDLRKAALTVIPQVVAR